MKKVGIKGQDISYCREKKNGPQRYIKFLILKTCEYYPIYGKTCD